MPACSALLLRRGDALAYRRMTCDGAGSISHMPYAGADSTAVRHRIQLAEFTGGETGSGT